MPALPLYVGLDLGTTNSAAAAFDGETLRVVRTSDGGVLTPSVVRVDRRGNVQVGAKARRFLDAEPQNTHAEFKRMMGTEHRFEFQASGLSHTPEALSSLVLRSLRQDVESQFGVAPTQAVVSVPALFELPQIKATSEAARLAGFERIEVIQEPVASALAAGWQRDSNAGAWLVYDLGGGTFDASLLESQDGVLRVVGHDGDNFLGGRDFDARIVDWMLEELVRAGYSRIERKNPAHALALRRLKLLAEEAKIELTRAASASIICSDLAVGGEVCEVDLELSREKLEELIEPLIRRTLEVCVRLLQSKGMAPEALSRVVLVGGPTVIPALRQHIARVLNAPIAPDIDPMTVVAQGAALFAATADLDGRPASASVPAPGPRVWLQYPAMTADLTPFVVGKLLAEREHIRAIGLRRGDGEWSSPAEPVAEDGTFAAMVSLLPRVTNTFFVEGLTASGRIALSPGTLRIIHGVSLGEPPLSRSIGVALADNSVHVYAERGTSLPLRRTFTQRTVEAVAPGLAGYALRIPIVQGEFPWAHLCRLVGVLELPSAGLNAALPADSAIELTLELDRGGRLQVRAYVPQLEQVFDQVAHLVIAGSTPEEIDTNIRSAEARCSELRARAFRAGDARAVARLGDIERLLHEAASLADAARGGDADAGQRARRLVIDAAAVLDEADAAHAWPELEAKVDVERALALTWLGRHGSAQERASGERAGAALDRALAAKNAAEVKRQLSLLRSLGNLAFFREPDAWLWEYQLLASRVSEASDVKRASALVQSGQSAADKGDRKGLESVVRALWPLLFVNPEERELSHGSGVR